MRVADDEEIDRAELVIDDRRTTCLRTDAKIHVEKCGELNLGFATNREIDSISSWRDADALVQVPRFRELLVRRGSDRHVTREDRTAAKKESLLDGGYVRDKCLPEQEQNFRIAMLRSNAGATDLDARTQHLRRNVLDAEFVIGIKARHATCGLDRTQTVRTHRPSRNGINYDQMATLEIV